MTAVFPETDHGILEFEERDGERVYTRYGEGYYPMMVEWIRSGTVTRPYGRDREQRRLKRHAKKPRGAFRPLRWDPRSVERPPITSAAAAASCRCT